MPPAHDHNSVDLIDRSPAILGGTPVFRGTRVPVRSLLEYLEDGQRIDDFLQDFPTVTREQAIRVLELASELVVS
jgi:uncharacterized protein (DUF433 family)